MALFILLFITLLSCAVITAADTTNNVTAEKTVSKDTITQKAVQTDKSVKNINTEKTKTEWWTKFFDDFFTILNSLFFLFFYFEDFIIFSH